MNDANVNGMRWNERHSRLHFGATTAKRDLPPPKKIRRKERVVYSNITWDFSALSGEQEYENITLQYKFILSDNDWQALRSRVDEFIDWLYEPTGYNDLYDSTDAYYHYSAELVSVTPSYPYSNVCEIDVVFEAYPFKTENFPDVVVEDILWPDIDDDGRVSASDAARILEAVSKIGSDGVSGLTEEQERRADANRDGKITASDAALVQQFVAAAGGGDYDNSPEGWEQFLRDQGVIE